MVLKEDNDKARSAPPEPLFILLSFSRFCHCCYRVGSIESANNLLRLHLGAHLRAYQRSLGAPCERNANAERILLPRIYVRATARMCLLEMLLLLAA